MMTNHGKSLLIAGIGALLLCGAAAARAQDNASAGAAPPPPAAGPAQLRDFRLPGRTVVPQQPAQQPPQQQPAPALVAPPSPVTTGRPAAQPPARSPALATPRREAPAPIQAPTSARQAAPEPAPVTSAPAVPLDAAPLPAPAAQAPQAGAIPWLYAIPAAALALLAFVLIRRRRRREEEREEAPALEAPATPTPAPVPAPTSRPAPLPRPWLELELKAERAQSTDAETLVQFELEIVNSGKAPARNLRIDVKMFNAGQEQDKEIGAFFRTAGREGTKCSLPGIAPGTTGAIKGSVAMPRDEMKAVRLQDRYLFIPVIAINALYDWGDGQTGQTSKSYVVGRELEAPSEKMGAFRVDLGPRIWRTVGQRQHKLARRV
jgi:hypothetical protein